LLREHGIEHDYREYSKDPLSLSELRELFGKLGVSPRELLRKRDKAFGELGLSGDEDDETLLGHMAEHPTLLQRPIGVLGDRAVVGRPHTDLLTLLD
jgi:arsenate reductase